MSFMNLSIVGLAETIAKFEALKIAAEKANEVGLEKAGETVLAKAQRLAPEDTGHLKKNTIAKFENGAEYVGTKDTPYARFQEYGFHDRGGDFHIHSYLRPAMNGAKPEVLDAYAIVLGAAIRAIVGL